MLYSVACRGRNDSRKMGAEEIIFQLTHTHFPAPSSHINKHNSGAREEAELSANRVGHIRITWRRRSLKKAGIRRRIAS